MTPVEQQREPGTVTSRRQPSPGYALLAIVAVSAVICIALIVFKAPVPLAMMFGLLAALPFGLALRMPYDAVETVALDMVRRGLPAFLIFVAVGALISTWVASGTVPTLIYGGLKIISPQWFLPAALLLCVVASLVNGTNWGTVATVGLALMGVAHGLGIPAGVAAGAIVCGAIFGDKMSPVSDTTIMAPALSGAKLMPHIRHMMWTTVPAIVISIVIFTVIGLRYDVNAAGTRRIETITKGLDHAFQLGVVPLLPAVLVLVLLALRMPAFPVISAGAIAGGVVAVFYQHNAATDVLVAAWEGYTPAKSLGEIGGLLSGGETGGIAKMMGLAAIMLFALAIGGVFHGAGILDALLDAIRPRVDTPRKLVPFTLAVTLVFNAIGAAVNFAVAMTATLLRPLYDQMGLATKNLSRATEDCANTSGVLLPWNATAVFTAGALGVSVASYAPFAFFCFLTPLISLIYGLTGFTITKADGN